MDGVKILERREQMDWDYDQEADVLSLGIGKPRNATGVDIGDGVVVRYDEKRKEVVGVTILGVLGRLTERLTETSKGKRR